MVTVTPASATTSPARTSAVRQAVLVTVRFGEYLRDQLLLTEEQWLAALAAHWSEEPRRRFGDAVVAQGFLSSDAVERAAAEFHDGLDVVEISSTRRASSESELD
jgi:hypothetical protein